MPGEVPWVDQEWGPVLGVMESLAQAPLATWTRRGAVGVLSPEYPLLAAWDGDDGPRRLAWPSLGRALAVNTWRARVTPANGRLASPQGQGKAWWVSPSVHPPEFIRSGAFHQPARTQVCGIMDMQVPPTTTSSPGPLFSEAHNPSEATGP